MQLQGIVVERTPGTDTNAAVRGSQRLTVILIVLVLAGSVAAFPLLFYTFWVVLEAIAKAWHLPHGGSLFGHILPNGFATVKGWPFDGAFFLALLAAWGILFLGYDRVAFFDNNTLRETLRRRAERVRNGSLPPTSFFVELRPDPASEGGVRLQNDWKPDIGWLVIEPERLHFVGDALTAVISREAAAKVARATQLEGNALGLAATWVRLPLGADRKSDLRILVRDDATNLSDTTDGARRLADALNAFTATATSDKR